MRDYKVEPNRPKFSEKELSDIRELFDYELEPSLASWLLLGEPLQAFGLPLLGLPKSPEPNNAWGATMFMRAANPMLPLNLLVIRIIYDRALCVGIGSGTSCRNTMLAEVVLTKSTVPVWLGKSIHQYLDEARADIARTETILNHFEKLLDTYPTQYDHKKGGDKPRSHMWRFLRSCVHDHIVGFAALQQDETLDAAKIDVFECTDHPLYERGHGVRSLMSLILADCIKAGTSLRIYFREVPGLRPKGLPMSVEQLAIELGVELSGKNNGIIEHCEGLQFLCRLSRLTCETITKVCNLGERQELSIQGLCALTLDNIWTPEEVEWVICNASAPDSILFGKASPEDWLLFKLALSSARRAVLATILRNSLSEGGSEGVDACSQHVDGQLTHYRIARPTKLVWNREMIFDQGESVSAFIVPRLPQKNEQNLILADAKQLAGLAMEKSHKLLVYGNEHQFADTPVITQSLTSHNVTLAIAPYSLRELDDIVERKWQKARAVVR